MLKNVANQKFYCFAYTASTGAAKTGDAANITAYLSKDGAAAAQTNDVNPAEMDATNMKGWYAFDATQAESNGDVLILAPASATAGVVIDQVQIHTFDATISSRASQTSVDTIDDFLDTEIAAILADTNELQTDWVDGGRLDLILDARASQASVDDIPTSAETSTAAELADAIWDELRAGHVIAGSFGEGAASVQGNVTGNVTGSVGSVAAGGITAASIATDAIDADAIAANAVTEIQSGLALEATSQSIFNAVDHIAITGSALNIVADGATVTTGTPTGTYANTEFDNGVYHSFAVVGTTIDVEYLFTLPTTAAVPASVQVTGYLNEPVAPGGDTIALMAYNYVAAGWDTLDAAIFTGILGTTDATKTHNLLARNVGTAGGDARKMRIRFYSTSLEVGTTLNIDAITVSYAEAISTSVASILADTNELQTDWTNGGRLDLILDDVKLDTGTMIPNQFALVASQASVNDLPTNAELAAALASADDAVLAAIAALNNLSQAGAQAGAAAALTAYDAATAADVTALNDISTADILAMAYEGAETLQAYLRLSRAALVGKATGGGTANITFRDAADTKDRIAATVDADGNRSAVVTDAS